MTLVSQTVRGLPAPSSYYSDDPSLQAWVGNIPWAQPVLEKMGATAAGLEPLVALADAHPPVLHPRDRYGNRTDTLEFHPAYRELQQVAYGQGLIGPYYDAGVRATLGVDTETVKFAQGYLFSQAEQGLYCPVCMTDGVAFLIERFGSDDQKARYLPHLTSRSLDTLWEGGMWLTEKAGGSDVGANETVATPLKDGRYSLQGEKWFCSNAGAEAVMVLGRPPGAPSGTRGLGLFILNRHDAEGRLNGLHLERLKDKLGTRSMPTGEVILDGAVVEAVGDVSRGFVQMAEMLNLSRLYNATASVSLMRRAIRESVRYARTRHTFGQSILSQPLVRSTLVEMQVEQEAALATLLTVARTRGRLLFGQASEEDRALLRVATPLLKYTTARQAVRTASEAVEMHGGNGYIEDWPLPRLLRDAQVLPIWEGTTNILVLDTLRAIHKDHAHQAIAGAARRSGDARLVETAAALEAALPQALQDTAHARRWCDRAMQVLQAGVLSALPSSPRTDALRENYMLRHFSPDRHDLAPRHVNHGLDAFGTLVDPMA